MPLQSQQQARFLNWKFGHDWLKQHHFGQKWGSLPKYKLQRGLSQVPNRGLFLFRRRLLSKPVTGRFPKG
jgi:hypothetical protein